MIEIIKKRVFDYLSQKKPEHRPLRVVIKLGSPIALTHPWMHFDSLIKLLVYKKALGEDFFSLPAKLPLDDLVPNNEMPAFPILIDRLGLYHASVSLFDTDKKALEVIYKRFEDRWAPSERAKIYRGSGQFKDYMIQHIYIPAKETTFYVFGDPGWITELLFDAFSLGDNRRLGWGEIRSVKTEFKEVDMSIVWRGIAMRPIPVRLLKSCSEAVRLAWRPPYWDKKNVELCAPPGAKIKFKDD